MEILCEKCQTRYDVADHQLQGRSLRVKCSSCGHIFRAHPTPLEFDATQPWFIRYKDDDVIARVPDLATLQRWIVERRISPQDETSQNEKRWCPLGEIEQLQPFFSVVQLSLPPRDTILPLDSPLPSAPKPSAQIKRPNTGMIPSFSSLQDAVKLTDSPSSTPAASLRLSSPDERGVMGATLEFGFDLGSLGSLGLPSSSPLAAPALPAPVSPPPEVVPAPAPSLSSPASAPSPNAPVSSAPKAFADGNEASSPLLAASSPSSPASKPSSKISPSSDGLPEVHPKTEVGLAGASLHENEVSASWIPASPSSESSDSPLFSPRLNGSHRPSSWQMGDPVDPAHAEATGWSLPSIPLDENPSPSISRSFAPIPRKTLTSTNETETDLREFSASFVEDERAAPYIEEDDLLETKSPWLRWFFLIFFILLGFGGIAFVLFPSLRQQWGTGGAGEVNAEMLDSIEKERAKSHLFRPELLQEAQNNLKRFFPKDPLLTPPSPSLLLARGEIALAQLEILRFQAFLEDAQIRLLQADAAPLKAEIASIPAEDTERSEQRKSLQMRLKSLLGRSQESSDRSQKFQADTEPLRRQIGADLQQVQRLQPTHPRLPAAQIYFESFQPSDPEIIKTQLQRWRNQKNPLPEAQLDPLTLIEASLLLRHQKAKEALPLLQSLLQKKNSAWLDAAFLAARAFYETAQTKETRKLLEKIFLASPEHPLALGFRALLSSAPQTPSPPSAPPSPLAPSESSAPSAPSPSPSPPAPSSHVAQPPPRTFAGLFQIAEKMRRGERYTGAIRYYRLALKKKRDVRALSGLGWSLLEAGKKDQALSAFQQALSISPDHADATYGIGLTYRRLDQKEEAKKYLKRFLARWPRSRDAAEVRLILQSL